MILCRAGLSATAGLSSISRPYLGRAYVTGFRLCRLSSVCLYGGIVAKRCVLKQKLLSTAYKKLYMRNRLLPK